MKYKRCLKKKGGVFTDDAKKDMYDQIGATLNSVESYALDYKSRADNTMRLLTQFKGNLTTDQKNFMHIKKVLSSASNHSVEDWEKVMVKMNITKEKREELKKNIEEFHSNSREKLGEIKTVGKTILGLQSKFTMFTSSVPTDLFSE